MLSLKRGFTLVELLVVVSIIGVLASLALVSYTGTQKQARDTQRKSDLKQYQNALENYANLNDSFYPLQTSSVNLASVCASSLSLSSCPDDPRLAQGNENYRYQSNTSATIYVVWARLENVDEYWVSCSGGAVGTITPPLSVSEGNCPI